MWVSHISGLYVVKNAGRRPTLIIGALWMMMCFLVYAFVGHFFLDSTNPMSREREG
ncbi:hypothetical protein BGZ61DRAFT_542665 [Ilyonectria robusta]|uniref:uncharacterized protein n=1 Tax=Ilyonectria robusta TaxID=1079257 RepID=UPI001E8E38A4|nr:uncharacterized protein BGZ61DRAFT_542665 [Ilyonectria robusta]KAH8645924.1 hypothetical protein BGZ61DRAFT_542665 [Ilyonectria robusta]